MKTKLLLIALACCVCGRASGEDEITPGSVTLFMASDLDRTTWVEGVLTLKDNVQIFITEERSEWRVETNWLQISSSYCQDIFLVDGEYQVKCYEHPATGTVSSNLYLVCTYKGAEKELLLESISFKRLQRTYEKVEKIAEDEGWKFITLGTNVTLMGDATLNITLEGVKE